MIRKGNTRKSVDQILDEAADILEYSGWVSEHCYDSETGGYCALGAVAQAVYPKATGNEIDDLAYVTDKDEWEYARYNKRAKDPRHVEAVEFLAQRIAGRKLNDEAIPDEVVYGMNDDLDDGIERTYDYFAGKHVVTVNEKIRVKSSKRVVSKLRNAAKAYRAKAAA